jgi:hypothetical protein
MRLLPALGLIFLFGCASASIDNYDRGGAAADQFERDGAACEMESIRAKAAQQDGWVAQSLGRKMFDACMRSKGYRAKE